VSESVVEPVKVGRYRDAEREFWAVRAADARSVRELRMPFDMWAAIGPPGWVLGPDRPLEELRSLPPVRPGARVFGVEQANPDDDSYARPLLGWIKPATALIGAGATMRFPAHTTALDCEPEVVVVIGRAVSRRATPTDAVLGWTLGGDTSVRDVGRPTGAADLYTMKAQDEASPVGPTIVIGPADDVLRDSPRTIAVDDAPADPITAAVDDLAAVLLFLDERCRLRPGDLVFTGTGRRPTPVAGRWLAEGGRVRISAAGADDLEVVVGAKERARRPSRWSSSSPEVLGV